MPGPQTPRPPRAPTQQDAKKNPLGYVLSKWKDFTTQAENGALDANNAKSIRLILSTHPRNAILQGLLSLKANIFVNMHPLLDPRVAHDGCPPALTAEQYARENARAIDDLKTLSKTRMAASQAGSSAGTPSQQGSSPVGTPQPQQTGGASPNPTATSSPRPTAPPTTAATSTPQSVGRPPIRPAPIPAGMMTLIQVRQILALPEPQRTAAYANTPGLKERFQAAVIYFQSLNAKGNEAAAARAAAGGNARPPNNSAPSSGPSTPSSSQNQSTSNNNTNTNPNPNQNGQTQNQQRPPAQATPARPPPNNNPHAATPTPNPNPTSGIPNRPFNLNLPPQRQGSPIPPQPAPVENERARRKRKLREYVREEAPGLEVEVGVDQMVSEYLDAFIDEAARGAIRLAKHRKGTRVELKDMALFLDVTHDVRLPGFNVQLPQRQHVSADTDRKRGKAVAPRAARKVKEAE